MWPKSKVGLDLSFAAVQGLLASLIRETKAWPHRTSQGWVGPRHSPKGAKYKKNRKSLPGDAQCPQ